MHQNSARITAKAETARCHAQEKYDNDLAIVQELEQKLNIARRWEPHDEEWQKAGRLVARRQYQRALDTLEGLIIARIFELGRMNRAGTGWSSLNSCRLVSNTPKGYKLRKHIGKALQSRSSAIKTALEHYNMAAHALSPPRRPLSLAEVLDYTFLADFELLHDTCEDVSLRSWASPTARLALDTHFKLCRAQEELDRLNIEIRRFVTHIRDEDKYLRECVARLQDVHPTLAHQVSILHNVRGCFNAAHLTKLQDLTTLSGFSGTLEPGVSIKKELGDSAGAVHPVVPIVATTPRLIHLRDLVEDHPEDLDEEEEEEELAEEHSHILEVVLTASSD